MLAIFFQTSNFSDPRCFAELIRMSLMHSGSRISHLTLKQFSNYVIILQRQLVLLIYCKSPVIRQSLTSPQCFRRHLDLTKYSPHTFFPKIVFVIVSSYQADALAGVHFSVQYELEVGRD